MSDMDKHYSDDKFWKKISKFAVKAGHSVTYTGLLLYFTLQKPELPLKAKAIIVGALGYFIFPFDAIPDIAVGIGYTDDLGALGVALLQVAVYIDEDVKRQAKGKMRDWFGDDFDTSAVDDKI